MHEILSIRQVVLDCALAILCALSASVGVSAEAAEETEAQRGYRLLRTKAYLPPDFDEGILDQLWTLWERPLREQARAADATTRRQMAYQRYGLVREEPVGHWPHTAVRRR